jgi:hypothetical protein
MQNVLVPKCTGYAKCFSAKMYRIWEMLDCCSVGSIFIFAELYVTSPRYSYLGEVDLDAARWSTSPR